MTAHIVDLSLKMVYIHFLLYILVILFIQGAILIIESQVPYTFSSLQIIFKTELTRQ